MSDEQLLLIAVPLRHLKSADGSTCLPAGGPGDLDAASPGMPVIVMATDAGEDEVPAVTWSAAFLRRIPYEPGSPWPEGLPATWTEEHDVSQLVQVPDPTDDDDDDQIGPQSFLEVADLRPLPPAAWLFANELVGKQTRGGRSYRPRVPIIVDRPD